MVYLLGTGVTQASAIWTNLIVQGQLTEIEQFSRLSQ